MTLCYTPPVLLSIPLVMTVAACAGSTHSKAASPSSVPADIASLRPSSSPRNRCPLRANSDPLCVTNATFRRAYADLRTFEIEASGPVIISLFSRVILLHNGQRHEARTIGQEYHELKSIAHVPLTIHVMLTHRTDRALDDTTRASLTAFRTQVQNARTSIDTRALDEIQRQRQRRLLDGGLSFLDRVLRAGRISTASLQAYTRGTASDVLENARDAAAAQLQATHTQVLAWLANMSAEEQQRLVVLVANGHMPRIGSLTSQYFTALLGAPYEGRFDTENPTVGTRVIAAEGIRGERALLKLLGTHLVAEEIGDRFFDDAERMHRDLLADAAEAWIAEHLNVRPNSSPSTSP